MPKKKKPAKDLTTEEVMQKVFPKPIIDVLKQVANPEQSKSLS